MIELNQKDVSLYELALSCEQTIHPLQVSPTIFKSLLGTIIDFLLDEQLPATLWMKLPRGALWQAEIDRLRQMASAPCSIYLLKNAGIDEPDGAVRSAAEAELDADGAIDLDADLDEEESNPASISADHADALLDDLTVGQTPLVDRASLVPLPLAPLSQLRREYFVLVQSPALSVLILAHRPRSSRGSKRAEGLVGGASPMPLRSAHRRGDDGEQASTRKHPLLSFCSFKGQTIRQVFDGIRQAIALGCAHAEPHPDAEWVLSHWDQMVEGIMDVPSMDLVGKLFNRQILRQEEIWRNSAVARQKAAMASELELLHQELLNANRLKDEFLQTVGQQLRTPLSSMKTALTLLNSPNLRPPQRQRYMELLTKECDRQSSLITGVLDLIQLENAADETPMQPLRLVDVVPAVVSTYQPLAQEKGVMLAYTIPDTLPAISCASAWLRQIVINLLHNGIKFTPTGGKVWVTAAQQGDYVQIEFRDTGIGIPAAEIPKVFERFYKARQIGDEDSNGAGLGLSIVQRLLLNCGGSVSVKSKVGEGSSFNVLLPVYHA